MKNRTRLKPGPLIPVTLGDHTGQAWTRDLLGCSRNPGESSYLRKRPLSGHYLCLLEWQGVVNHYPNLVLCPQWWQCLSSDYTLPTHHIWASCDHTPPASHTHFSLTPVGSAPLSNLPFPLPLCNYHYAYISLPPSSALNNCKALKIVSLWPFF